MLIILGMIFKHAFFFFSVSKNYQGTLGREKNFNADNNYIFADNTFHIKRIKVIRFEYLI
jgi:hypothetical protein